MQTGQHQTREIEEVEQEVVEATTSDDLLVDVSCPACQEEVASCKQCQDDLIRAAAAGNDLAPEPIDDTHHEIGEEEPSTAEPQEEQSEGLSIPEENKRKKGQLLSYQPTISGASVDHQTPQSDSVPSSAPDAGSSSFKKIEPPTNIKPTIEGMSTTLGLSVGKKL